MSCSDIVMDDTTYILEEKKEAIRKANNVSASS